MSQHSMTTPVTGTVSGVALSENINGIAAALASCSSGPEAPEDTFPNMWWADTTASILKRRNAADSDWVAVMSLSLAISNYMETVLASANSAAARNLLNAFSSSGGNLTGALNEARTTVASHATTADIWAALGNSINWTGTAITTTFPNAPQAGAKRWLHCAGNSKFINSATLKVQGAADFQAEAEDIVLVEAITVTTFKLSIIKINGKAVVESFAFSTAAENAAGSIEGKAVDPLGIREAFNATGSAPVFAARAWVNFNGQGAVAIRASGNVSSITDNGVGDYTINFATAMPDINYGLAGMSDIDGFGQAIIARSAGSAPTTTSVRILSFFSSSGAQDHLYNSVSIHR